ncbi:MAG: hypothetical protein LC772_06740 [Chloroflexi bacterium]|nr:hypothetical protein [Chloroflexota bacterium]
MSQPAPLPQFSVSLDDRHPCPPVVFVNRASAGEPTQFVVDRDERLFQVLA